MKLDCWVLKFITLMDGLMVGWMGDGWGLTKNEWMCNDVVCITIKTGSKWWGNYLIKLVYIKHQSNLLQHWGKEIPRLRRNLFEEPRSLAAFTFNTWSLLGGSYELVTSGWLMTLLSNLSTSLDSLGCCLYAVYACSESAWFVSNVSIGFKSDKSVIIKTRFFNMVKSPTKKTPFCCLNPIESLFFKGEPSRIPLVLTFGGTNRDVNVGLSPWLVRYNTPKENQAWNWR